VKESTMNTAIEAIQNLAETQGEVTRIRVEHLN